MGNQGSTLHPGTLLPPAVIPLAPGERLTRAECARRYEAMPHLAKAELLEGIVYLPSPVRLQRHGQPQACLIWGLMAYDMATPGVITADHSPVRLDLANAPQPDALWMIDPAHGGQARVSADD